MNTVKILERYCKEMNDMFNLSYRGDISELFETIYGNMVRELPDSALYYNKSVFIKCGCDFCRCREVMFEYPHLFKCELSDDMDEHPGLTIKFKDDKEETY